MEMNLPGWCKLTAGLLLLLLIVVKVTGPKFGVVGGELMALCCWKETAASEAEEAEGIALDVDMEVEVDGDVGVDVEVEKADELAAKH